MRSVSQSASNGLQMASTRLARSAHNVVVNNLGIAKNSVPTASEAVRLYLSGELPKSVLNPKVPEFPKPEALPEASNEPEPYVMQGSGVEPTHDPGMPDLARESVVQATAVRAFEANVAMLKSDDQTTKRLLEVKA